MKSEEQANQQMRILIQIIARAAIPVATVKATIGAGKKQITAFNLCDGTVSQKEISKKTGIDPGQLSRTSGRWVENGIAFWIGEGKDTRLLHVYPVPSNAPTKAKKKRK